MINKTLVGIIIGFSVTFGSTFLISLILKKYSISGVFNNPWIREIFSWFIRIIIRIINSYLKDFLNDVISATEEEDTTIIGILSKSLEFQAEV